MNIYINILDLDFGVIIYECKDNSDVKLFKVDNEIELWDKIKEQAHTMNEMVELRKLPPPRPIDKNSKDCNYCDYKKICHSSKIWEDPNLSEKREQFYGNFN